MENIRDLVARVKQQQREAKIGLYAKIVRSVLIDDAIRVVELAQKLDTITDLQDVEVIQEVCIVNDITDIEEVVRSYFYGGDYDDLFKSEGCGRDLEIIQ